ncbi:MAG: S8 family peptidase, partial [Lewinella sp.]|nr:S8 family peptidase [Lewinella sp.]
MRWLMFVVLSGLLSGSTLAQSGWQEKVNPDVLADLSAGGTAEVIVVFQAQADLRGAYQLHGKEAKGQFVFNQVRAVAERTQGNVRRLLTAAGQDYRAFRIVNALVARLDYNQARQIAALSEVKQLQANPWAPLDEPLRDRSTVGHSRNVIEWGLERIQADDVWALGIQGSGIVVGGQDTGVEWYHPNIQQQYRGYSLEGDVDHNYNWHDAIHELSPLNGDTINDPSQNPCGLDSAVPCDDNNHGTYTVSIMIGDDGAGNQTGVAPLATWMGCRNMDRGAGSPATYIECFDWFLAPTDLAGENPDPSLAPHVINNSWGCPLEEGCNPDNFALMEQAVEALRAAGVVVVVSAGNSGPGCGSVDDPAAIFAGSFAVGATRSNDTIANFSSRGAVTVDGSMRLKPDISAPGVGIRAARRNDGYMSASGTSAAGPFVAGTVALMIEANPALAGEVDTIEQILRQTAVPMLSGQSCGPFPGGEIPNAVYGYGRLDALAAVLRAQQTVITGVAEMAGEANWLVFPNPAREQVYLTGQWNAEQATWRLFSSNGRLVQERALEQPSAVISLMGLPGGVYWYQISAAGAVRTGRLVVM